MRRLPAAIAAVIVALSTCLVFARPAQAAPGGACSTEEWTQPGNFTDCARRLRQAAVDASGCIKAPMPGSPAEGLAGWVTSEPESAKRDGVQGKYSMYGVGGYGMDTYDLGCLGTLKHPDLAAWNVVAKGEFGVAATVVGAANGLREHAYNPNTMWGWADPYIAEITDAVFTHVFSVFGVVAIVGVGLFLVWTARHGRMSQAVRMTTWALLILVVTIGLARWPLRAVHGADAVAGGGLSVVQSVLGPGPQNIPADQCVLGGDSCIDHRDVATRSSDSAVETVLYRPWLRAVLGDDDSDTAKKYGPALYGATTMTWGEAERADQSPGLRQDLINQKADTFNTIAQQIKTDDPQAYEYLQGVHGMDRAGAGFTAMIASLVYAFFDSLASIIIMLSFGIFRIAIVFFPLLATVGVFQPASAGVRRVANASIAAVFNIGIFGAASGIYLAITDAVFSSAVPGPAQIVVVAVCGFLCFVVTHPIRHLWSTATGRSRSSDSLVTRAVNSSKQLFSDRSTDPAPAASGAADSGTPEATNRPEAATRNRPTAREVAGATVDVLAPSARETVSHPVVTGVTDAISSTPRPEGTSVLAHLKSVASRAGSNVAAATTDPIASPTPAPAVRASSTTTSTPTPRAETRS